MKQFILTFLICGSLFAATEPINVNTADGKVKQTSSGTGVVTKPYDFSAVYARIVPRVLSITSSATPSINTDRYDAVTITALATAITSMTSSLSGTPLNFQKLIIRFKDDGSPHAITWGSSFVSSQATLPTTTVAGKVTTVGLMEDTVKAKWVCLAVDQEP